MGDVWMVVGEVVSRVEGHLVRVAAGALPRAVRDRVVADARVDVVASNHAPGEHIRAL